MPENPIKKFQQFWGSLSNEEQKDLWDIFTALRGEDEVKDESFKLFTTGRIRYLLAGKEGRAYLASSWKKAKESQEFFANTTEKITKANWRKHNYHWKLHIIFALNALEKHIPKSQRKDLQKFINWGSQ